MLSKKIRFWASVHPRYSAAIDKFNRCGTMVQWYNANAGVHTLPTRDKYFEYVSSEYLKDQPIDYLEFGVFEGLSMRKWSEMNKHPDSRFYGFDSFEGLPDTAMAWGPGQFDVGGVAPNNTDPRVQYVKGWFQNSLPGFLDSFQPRSRLVIHNDSDIYTSTLYVLTKLDRLIVPGTILMFDELSRPLHEWRAWQDYCSSYNRTAKPIALMDDTEGRAAFLF